MTIPMVFTKIKKRIEGTSLLDSKSKQIVLHIMRQVFKEIPKEDIIDYFGNESSPEVKTEIFDRIFGDIFKGVK